MTNINRPSDLVSDWINPSGEKTAIITDYLLYRRVQRKSDFAMRYVIPYTGSRDSVHIINKEAD